MKNKMIAKSNTIPIPNQERTHKITEITKTMLKSKITNLERLADLESKIRNVPAIVGPRGPEAATNALERPPKYKGPENEAKPEPFS